MAERQFGPYRLVEQIAVGGMAEIHLAKTRGIAGFEKYVALKMIHPNFSSDEQFIQMLIDEAKITVQLQHVNIAQTFDLGRVGDTFYITMEFVDGHDLYQMLRRGSERDIEMPTDIAAFIAKEVATGLDYAHRKRDLAGRPLGIVHRDVSPQNVLISRAGEIKIVDFGIAKATMRARQTAVGVIKGKYYYMSPEQAWGDPVDCRTDVFSSGILLYEMLTGQMLYLEEDLQRLLSMVRKADIAPPSTLRKGIPPQLERIVMHALNKRPEDRYQTAADFATDLERFLHAYSPVFTASKLSKFCAHVFDEEEEPPTIVEAEPVKFAERVRTVGRITAQLGPEALARSRSDFEDENSVIFAMQDVADRARARRDGNEPTAEAPPVRGRSTPSRGLGEATQQIADLEDIEDRTVVSGPPGFAHAGVDPQLLAAADDFDTTDIEASLPALPGDEPPEPPTRPPQRPIPRPQPRAAGPNRPPPPRPRGKRASQPPPLPQRRRPPTRPPPIPRPSDGDDGPTQVDFQPGRANAPAQEIDPMQAKTTRQQRKLPDRPVPPALAASVPKPAVSQIRTSRPSRRTPAGGVPTGPGAERPRRDSVLTSIVNQAVETSGWPAPASSPSVLPAPEWAPPGGNPQQPPPSMRPQSQLPLAAPLLPASAAPLGPHPLGSQPLVTFDSPAMQHALEIDELPPAYRIGRKAPISRRWLLRAGLVLLCIGLGAVIGVLLLDEPAPPAAATIDIVSIPPGARVTVNGETLPGVTPVIIPDAKPGSKYRIVIELDKYEPWERVETVAVDGRPLKVVAALSPVTVTLRVLSTPPNAEVFINGHSHGRTPITIPKLDPAQATTIELRLRGYQAERRMLDWSQDKEQVLEFSMTSVD